MSVRSASSVYVQYGIESTFGGGATQTKLFGRNQRATGLEWSNQQIALPQLFDPRYRDFLYNANAGNVNMEFTLSNPWIFTWMFGASSYSAGDPDTHTWDSDPATNALIRLAPTGHIEIGMDNTANIVRNAKGVVATSLNLKTSIDNPVEASMQLKWGLEDNISTTLDSSVATDLTSMVPFNFTQATVELPVATTLGTIQDLDFTININTDLLRQLGTPDAVDAWRKLIEITGRVTLAFETQTEIDQIRARVPENDMKILFTNGLTGDNERSIQINLGEVSLSKHGTDHSPGELVLQNFEFQALDIQVVAKNEDTVEP